MQKIADTKCDQTIAIMVASHSEDTVRYTVDKWARNFFLFIIICSHIVSSDVLVGIVNGAKEAIPKNVFFIARRMQEYGIKKTDGVICFGQLYGMCDQISFMLGQAGYSVYKYLPYGPVKEVLPYLSRRAQENSSLLKNVDKERGMLRQELKDRLMARR